MLPPQFRPPLLRLPCAAPLFSSRDLSQSARPTHSVSALGKISLTFLKYISENFFLPTMANDPKTLDPTGLY